MEEISERDAVISAANVLMVALLKMNRVIIPAFLKWRRAKRLHTIQKARRLVTNSLVRGGPHGEHAHDTALEGAKSASSPLGTVPALLSSTNLLMVSPQRTPSHSVQDLIPGIVDTPNPNPHHGQDSSTQDGSDVQFNANHMDTVINLTEEDRDNILEHMRLAERMHLFVYTSFVKVIITIVSIIFYAGIIIALVLTLFPVSSGQSLIFSFSLIATALISESEVLLQRRKHTEKDMNDLAKFRIKANPTRGNARPGLVDVDHFSDDEI